VIGGGRGSKSWSRDFVRRHFMTQDERPAGVREIEIDAVDPFLRGLLFTDGTVTRALGVQALAPVSVERVGQEEVPVPAAAAVALEIEPGEDSIRRRVRIGLGAAEPLLWAESFLVPGRLPPGFLGLLEGAPDGIGQSLQRVALESCRELLWVGFDTAPPWAAAAPGGEATIRRLYRILSGRQAAILISESFAVEERAGVFHLAGLGGTGASSLHSPEAVR
jgi:chorismate-pyruvate lyase